MFACAVCHADESRNELVEEVFRIDGKYVLVPFPLEYALYRISVSPVNHSHPRNRESRVRGSFTVSTNLSGNDTS